MPDTNLISNLYQEKFSAIPDVACHAPGRVNLIGDHTDYNDGFVLPVAINYATYIAASRRTDDLIRVFAKGHSQTISEFSLRDIQFNNNDMWLNYLAGTLKVLQERHSNINGANIVVHGDVPLGVGLSSSASFEIALLKCFKELYGLDLNGIEAAILGQEAENTFVGCNCGIMDQLISAMGTQGNAMLLDCRDLSIADTPIPDTHSILIVNSKVNRELVDSEYNIRRQQCEEAARFFSIKTLRDLSFEELSAAEHSLPPELYRRARHVVTENIRTQSAYKALETNDMGLLSQLMRESHESLRDDYEVSTPELDLLVAIIDERLGDAGGVRMTGGGFGGCVVALVPKELCHSIAEHVSSNYSKIIKIIPDTFVCTASQGAFRES